MVKESRKTKENQSKKQKAAIAGLTVIIGMSAFGIAKADTINTGVQASVPPQIVVSEKAPESVPVNIMKTEPQITALLPASFGTASSEMTLIGKYIKKPSPVKQCKNWLVRELERAGFKGKNLREAWAIVMRESGGRADAISSTGDYGMFQFNRSAHHSQDWWNTQKLLTKSYNAKVAYRMSKGGKWWGPWDISGDGQTHLAQYTPHSAFAKYKQWYNKYPCD